MGASLNAVQELYRFPKKKIGFSSETLSKGRWRLECVISTLFLLTASLSQPGTAPRLFWGLMESFHWSTVKKRPVGFAKKYGGYGATAECYRRHLNPNGSLVRPEIRAKRDEDAWYGAHGHGNLIGPFNFAKGKRQPTKIPPER